jgi:hypothetical protein
VDDLVDPDARHGFTDSSGIRGFHPDHYMISRDYIIRAGITNLARMTRRSDQKSGIKPQIYLGYNLGKSGGKWINPSFTPDLSKFYPRFVYIPPQIYPYFPPDKSGV